MTPNTEAVIGATPRSRWQRWVAAGYAPPFNRAELLWSLLFFALLGLTQYRNYLLFHAITEIYSVVIAFSVFVVAWTGRRYIGNGYLLFLGVAYLHIGFLDVLHTLGYTGMNVFPDYDYHANQLWIAARAMEAFALTVAVFSVRRRTTFRLPLLFGGFALATAAFVYSIFWSDIFPICFVPGQGQTAFKIGAEFALNGVFLIAMIRLIRTRTDFEPDIYRFMLWSIIFTIMSELAFTFYIDNYGVSNMIGHFAKIISFYLLYRAVVQKSITDPYATVFEELAQLNETNNELFAIVSHDLRSPFAAMIGVVEILQESSSTLSAAEREEFLDNLAQSIRSTSALTDNLLHWAYFEKQAQALSPAKHAVGDLIHAAIEPLLRAYEDKRIAVTTDCPPTVRIFVDRDTILIALRNILTNALKFSPRNSTVEITAEEDRDGVLVQVLDHGIGMKQSELRAANATLSANAPTRLRHTRGTGNEIGTGLGMNLIRRYSRVNDAELDVQSTEGVGTTVTLRFDSSSATRIP